MDFDNAIHHLQDELATLRATRAAHPDLAHVLDPSIECISRDLEASVATRRVHEDMREHYQPEPKANGWRALALGASTVVVVTLMVMRCTGTL